MSAHDISQRRACRLVGVDPKTVRRERAPDNPGIRARMRAIASERRRFGYRRIGLMLEREGIAMNHKKLRRLYREEGLSVRRRRGRKRATGTRHPLAVPERPGQRWSLDFLSDVFGPGRRFRILAVLDDFSRECLALVADTSLLRTPGRARARRTSPPLRPAGDDRQRQRHRADQPGDAGPEPGAHGGCSCRSTVSWRFATAPFERFARTSLTTPA